MEDVQPNDPQEFDSPSVLGFVSGHNNVLYLDTRAQDIFVSQKRPNGPDSYTVFFDEYVDVRGALTWDSDQASGLGEPATTKEFGWNFRNVTDRDRFFSLLYDGLTDLRTPNRPLQPE